MSNISAVIFDLYGTLLTIGNKTLLKSLMKSLGTNGSRFSGEAAERILTRRLDEPKDFLEELARMLAADRTSSNVSLLNAWNIITRHCDDVRPQEGIFALLRFLKARGFKLAVLSNVSSPFTKPVNRLKLKQYFDYVGYSCDIGFAKPHPNSYRRVCDELGVTPNECLFIGDSAKADYDAPRSLGMAALAITNSPRKDLQRLMKISELGWYCLREYRPHELISASDIFELGGRAWQPQMLLPLSDQIQGRYNLVARLQATTQEGEQLSFYVKRYLQPSSIHVEHLAYTVLELAGLQHTKSQIIGKREQILVMTPAPGVLWNDANLNASIVQSLGKHFAMAYVISNADFRPRNTLVNPVTNQISVIDLEHCFFDRTLKLPNDIDGTDPRTIDTLDDISRYFGRRVLSPELITRALHQFLPKSDLRDQYMPAFRAGWVDLYTSVIAKKKEIIFAVNSRAGTFPNLIIGTREHRRAFAKIDVQGIEKRLNEDPASIFKTVFRS